MTLKARGMEFYMKNPTKPNEKHKPEVPAALSQLKGKKTGPGNFPKDPKTHEQRMGIGRVIDIEV
jgi:hypothetical protein